MIPFVSDITPEDVEKSGKLVEFYLGSSDNITLDNAQALIDMFTDSGKILINQYLIDIRQGRHSFILISKEPSNI